MNMTKQQMWLIGTVLVLMALFFIFGLSDLLTLENLKAQLNGLMSFRQRNPDLTLLLFFIFYIAVTALSLPGAVIMTLAAGALFGFARGLVVVSFASSIGATLAFIIARYLFQKTVQERFGDHLTALNHGIEQDGAFYLFTLRLVPLFPFFIINLLMGLTPIKTWTFYWVSQLGMLAGTLVFINAGVQLAGIDSLDGLFSPGLIASFVLLGLFPWIARKAVAVMKERV